MTRIGFLALQAPGLSPSQRYRVEAFMPTLEKRGIDVDYQWVLDAQQLKAFYGATSVTAKLNVAVAALARRLVSLTRVRSWDVVFVQREAFFLFNHWSEWLASQRVPLVFDFDDAIWIHAVSATNRRFAFLKNVDKIPRIVGLAHTVIAGNDYLASWARSHNPNVHVIPTCVDTDLFHPPDARQAAGPVTIGWSGSPSTIAHLRPALPMLERVKARLGARVRLRVMGDPTFHHPPLDLHGEAWSPDAELEFLRQMDIGLMPLPDDPWTRGKCGLKGLTSMASGAATVMSPVGVNTAIIEHGVNGFLAASDDEWVDTLCRLVDDAPLRHRIGAAGRDTVVNRYSVQRWSDPLADLLSAASRRAK